jgi:hypothetical protein
MTDTSRKYWKNQLYGRIQMGCNSRERREKDEDEDKKSPQNGYGFDGAEYLKHTLNINLTEVEGLEVKIVLIFLSVTGTDMSKWPNVDALASWLSLAPRPRISNGKLKGHEKRKTTNPATLALRIAARLLHHSDSWFGQVYRKTSLHKGPRAANKSVARHLAILIYTLIKNGTEYDEKYLEDERRQQRIREECRFLKTAGRIGYEVFQKKTLNQRVMLICIINSQSGVFFICLRVIWKFSCKFALQF